MMTCRFQQPVHNCLSKAAFRKGFRKQDVQIFIIEFPQNPVKASADRCFVQTAPNAFDTRRIAVLTVGFHRLVRCDDTHAVPVCRRLTAFFTDGFLHRVLRTLDNGQVSLRRIVTVTHSGCLRS